MTAATTSHPPLRRNPADGYIAGVCAGIGRRIGADPVWVRLAFVAVTLGGGFGIPIYALAWVLVPDDGSELRRRLRTRRSAVEVSLGAGFLVLAGLLAVRASGVAWFSDVVTWPLV